MKSLWIIGAAVVFFISYILMLIFNGRNYPKVIVCRTQIENLKTRLDLFNKKQGYYPTTAQGLDSLNYTLASGPNKMNLNSGVNSIASDPWGRKFEYISPVGHQANTYEIFSLGPEGVVSGDDIHLSK